MCMRFLWNCGGTYARYLVTEPCTNWTLLLTQIGDLKTDPTLDVIEESEASLITSAPPHLNSVCFDV